MSACQFSIPNLTHFIWKKIEGPSALISYVKSLFANLQVLRECMAQINNGKLDGEAVADFETPEDDPDIKGISLSYLNATYVLQP